MCGEGHVVNMWSDSQRGERGVVFLYARFYSVDYSVHSLSAGAGAGAFHKKYIVDTFYGFVTVRAVRQNSIRQRSET